MKRYDRDKREALCQVLRMHDVRGKLLNSIKMFVNKLGCPRVIGGESYFLRLIVVGSKVVSCSYGFSMSIWM